MILTLSLTYDENLSRAVQKFIEGNEKTPDYILIHPQPFYDFLNTLNDEQKPHWKFGRPNYKGIPLILSIELNKNEIVPVRK